MFSSSVSLSTGNAVSTKKNTTLDDGLTFNCLAGDSGYSNLQETVSINGVSVTPSWKYTGANASTTELVATAGTTLPIASSGTDVSTGQYTPFTTETDTAVLFNSGKVYQAASAATGDPGANDIMLEAICQISANEASVVIAKGNMDGITPSYNLWIGSSYTKFQFNDAAGSVCEVSSYPNVNPGTWIVLHAFLDASDTAGTGCRLFINGISAGYSSHTAISTLSGGKLTIGARSDFTLKYDKNIAYVAQYDRAGWFAGGADNTTQWTAFAEERMAKLAGVYPQLAKGQAKPSLQQRNTAATLDRYVNKATGERRLFTVGYGWMRLCEWKEATGGEYLKGFLAESQITNILLGSESLIYWSKLTAGDTYDSNIIATPDGQNNGDKLIALDTTPGIEHGFRQAITLVAAGYTYSMFLKKGYRDIVYLRDATIANCIAYFNLNTGTVGTVGAGVGLANIEPYGNDWYRCSITLTGTAASHNFDVGATDTDGATTYTATSNAGEFYMFGGQVEATSYPSSYIYTSTSTASRNGDELQYLCNGNITDSATRETKILANRTSNSTLNCYIAEYGNASNRNILYLGSGEVARHYNTSAGAFQAENISSVDILDKEIHSIVASTKTDSFKLKIDSETVIEDTSGTPSLLSGTSMYIGNSLYNNLQPGMLIGAIKHYSKQRL